MINGNDLFEMLKQVVEIHKQDNEYKTKVLELQESRTYNEKQDTTKVNIKLKTKMHHPKFSNNNTNNYIFTEQGNTTELTTIVENLHSYCFADKHIQIMHYNNPKNNLGQNIDDIYHLLITYK